MLLRLQARNHALTVCGSSQPRTSPSLPIAAAVMTCAKAAMASIRLTCRAEAASRMA